VYFYNDAMLNNDLQCGDPVSFQDLLKIVQRLFGQNGCPWDLAQTHKTLKRNLLEECYEVLEAIDSGHPEKICEELGDLLAQVVFHCQIAAQAGNFNVEDVLSGVNEKLVRRHPHVFGHGVVSDVLDVERQWEKIKETEGTRKSRVDGVPNNLPALAAAQLLQDRVSRDGFDWEDVSEVLDKLVEEVGELQDAQNVDERANEFGDLLMTMVNIGRWMGIQSEDSLRQANGRFRRRYTMMETAARHLGLGLATLTLDQKEELWREAKQRLDE
jgi:tetrapyrrole methylase family protein/MazG family protein